MNLVKTTLYALVVLAALAAFGWFFVSQLGTGQKREEPAAVLLAPPPEYSVVNLGTTSSEAAAAQLEAKTQRPGADKVGVQFERNGAVVYWLADLRGDVLEEREAGASGTRVQTVWRGGVQQRLRWAREHGDFETPGLPASEKKNLYH
jgi:hypothetical protein